MLNLLPMLKLVKKPGLAPPRSVQNALKNCKIQSTRKIVTIRVTLLFGACSGMSKKRRCVLILDVRKASDYPNPLTLEAMRQEYCTRVVIENAAVPKRLQC